LATLIVCAVGVGLLLGLWRLAPEGASRQGASRNADASAGGSPVSAPEASSDQPGSAVPAPVSETTRGSIRVAEAPLTVEALRREAQDVIQQAMKDFPKSTTPLVLMGNFHLQLGNRAEAVKWWQKVLKRDPKRADVYYRMAGVASENGDYQHTEKLCRRARQIAPTLKGVNQRLGQALLELGKPEEAAKALEEEIRRHPQTNAPYSILGQAYLQLKQFDKAVANYEKALEMTADDSRACYGMSLACLRLGQTDEAGKYRERFRKLRSAESESVRAERKTFSDLDWMCGVVARIHVDAGHAIYSRRRRLREAEWHLNRAAVLDPKDQICRQRLVDLYVHQKRYTEALKIGQQLRQLDPANPNYHLNAGVFLATLRRFDAAEEALRKGIEVAPERPDGYRLLVPVLMHGARKLPDAQAVAEKLVELEPTATNYHTLCQACEANRDLNGAWAAIEQAHKMVPKSGRIRRAYERLKGRADPEQTQEKE